MKINQKSRLRWVESDKKGASPGYQSADRCSGSSDLLASACSMYRAPTRWVALWSISLELLKRPFSTSSISPVVNRSRLKRSSPALTKLTEYGGGECVGTLAGVECGTPEETARRADLRKAARSLARSLLA